MICKVNSLIQIKICYKYYQLFRIYEETTSLLSFLRRENGYI